jgi:ribosomal protein S7
MNNYTNIIKMTGWVRIIRSKSCLGGNFVLAKNFMSQTGLKKINTAKGESKRVPVLGIRAGRRKIRELRVKWPVDVLYSTSLLPKLQNKLMRSGKKGQAERLLLTIMTHINRYGKGHAGILFCTALEKLKPTLGTVTRRAGRNYYQVPVPLDRMRQYKMAFQWLLEVSRKDSLTPAVQNIADEIINVVLDQNSEALKKKEALYSLVVKNRAYHSYR